MDYDSDLIFQHNKTGRDSTVRNMLRQAKVVEPLIDETGVFARVQYLDKMGVISRPLPILQSGCKGSSFVQCPKIGDDVSVMMLPNSDGGEGFIIGSFYNSSNPPPITELDVRHITFADGTIIEYTEATNTRATGQLRIKSTQPINIESGDCYIKATSIKLEADKVTIQAGNIELIGEVKIEGNINHEGDMLTTGVHTDSLGRHC